MAPDGYFKQKVLFLQNEVCLSKISILTRIGNGDSLHELCARVNVCAFICVCVSVSLYTYACVYVHVHLTQDTSPTETAKR